MSTAIVDRPVAPVLVIEQKSRWASLLATRADARAALNVALRVPARAVTFILRKMQATRIGQRAAAMRRPLQPFLWRLQPWFSRLSRSGLVAVVAAAASSERGSDAIRRAAAAASSAASRIVRVLGRAADTCARSLGRPGQLSAEAIRHGVTTAVTAGRRLTAKPRALVEPLLQRRAQLRRVVNTITRSYLAHRLAVLLVRPRWLRLVAETLVLPLVGGSRVREELQRGVVTRTLRARLMGWQRSHPALTVVEVTPPVDAAHPVAAAPVALPVAPRPDVEAESPAPGNRAERRALQREEARLRHHPIPRPLPQGS